MSQRVVYWIQRLMVSLIRICSHRAQLLLEPCFAVLEKQMMILKEVESPKERLSTFKSQRNESYATCTFNLTLVLATQPRNLPAVRVLTGGSVLFGSRPRQKPDQLVSWRVVTRPRHRTAGIWSGWNQPTVPNLWLLQLWLQLSL